MKSIPRMVRSELKRQSYDFTSEKLQYGRLFRFTNRGVLSVYNTGRAQWHRRPMIHMEAVDQIIDAACEDWADSHGGKTSPPKIRGNDLNALGHATTLASTVGSRSKPDEAVESRRSAKK